MKVDNVFELISDNQEENIGEELFLSSEKNLKYKLRERVLSLSLSDNNNDEGNRLIGRGIPRSQERNIKIPAKERRIRKIVRLLLVFLTRIDEARPVIGSFHPRLLANMYLLARLNLMIAEVTDHSVLREL